MTLSLGEWFNLAIYCCGFLAGAATLACALQIRRTMPTGLPAAPVTEGDGTNRGSNLTKTRNDGLTQSSSIVDARTRHSSRWSIMRTPVVPTEKGIGSALSQSNRGRRG